MLCLFLTYGKQVPGRERGGGIGSRTGPKLTARWFSGLVLAAGQRGERVRMRSCGELAGRSNRRELYRFHCQSVDFELPPLSSCVCFTFIHRRARRFLSDNFI